MANFALLHENAAAITTHPLEPFALAWLRRWTHFGASARLGRICEMDEDTNAVEPQLCTSFPTYHYSPAYEDDEDVIGQPADSKEWWVRERRSFNQHFYDGKLRELHDLMDAVQGGFDAIRALIEVLPELGEGRPLRRNPFAQEQAA